MTSGGEALARGNDVAAIRLPADISSDCVFRRNRGETDNADRCDISNSAASHTPALSKQSVRTGSGRFGRCLQSRESLTNSAASSSGGREGDWLMFGT